MTPQKHKNGSSGAALMPPRHQTHADSLPEHTSAAASTPVGERPAALQEAVFTRLFDQAEIAKFNPQDRMNYEESLKDYRDMYSVMKTQLEKGRAEGRAEEKLANARALKDNGVPLDVIARSLGLNDEQMKEL